MSNDLAKDNRAFAREFLYKALEDTQGTIRSIDTKAGVGIVILGAMVGKMLDQEQIAAVSSAGPVTITVAIAWALLAVVSAVLAFKTVFPMINPAENVDFPDTLRPAFFLVKLNPSRFLRLFSSGKCYAKLAETHAAYYQAVQKATPETVEQIAAAEVLKLSFIRQLKTDRLAAFAIALSLTVVAFIALIGFMPKRPKPASDGKCATTIVEVGPRDVK